MIKCAQTEMDGDPAQPDIKHEPALPTCMTQEIVSRNQPQLRPFEKLASAFICTDCRFPITKSAEVLCILDFKEESFFVVD